MANSGRKKKPTALNELANNPGKRPLPKNEPKPPPAARLTPPSWLSKAAKAEWKTLVPKLLKSGLLSVLDTHQLATHCDTAAKSQAAAVELDKRGMVFDPDTVKLRIYHKSLLAELRHQREGFGMTPSARAGLDIVPEAATPGGKETPKGGKAGTGQPTALENATTAWRAEIVTGGKAAKPAAKKRTRKAGGKKK